MNRIDLVGNRYGMLVVTAERTKQKYEVKVCVCKCDCGKVVKVRANELRRKEYPKISCGCTTRPKAYGRQHLHEYRWWSRLLR